MKRSVIATDEVEGKNPPAVALGRLGGKKSGPGSAAPLSRWDTSTIPARRVYRVTAKGRRSLAKADAP